jgi:hypothetical protein
MASTSGANVQLITALITFYLIASVPFVILNSSISKRKGKKPHVYVLLSIIPIVGYLLTWYLISLTDSNISDKLNQALQLIEKIENGRGISA